MYTRIRDLREDSDISQARIAEIFGMHTTQYRRYELGESDIPLGVAIKLAKHYNVSLDYIAGLSRKKIPLNKD